MRGGVKKILAGLAMVAALSAVGCNQVDQAACDDVELLERQLDEVAGDLSPEIEEEVREDYAEIATTANCPGYNEPDD